VALERELLAAVRAALDAGGFWDRFDTWWVCLDCELMPWSAKALELVRQQYASVGTAARVDLNERREGSARRELPPRAAPAPAR
jgi:protein phosphatase